MLTTGYNSKNPAEGPEHPMPPRPPDNNGKPDHDNKKNDNT